MEEYYPGKGCKCYAHSENECCCNVDWTEPEVYELRKWKEAIIDELHNCQILSKEHYDNPKKALHDIVMWHIEVTEYFNKQNKWHNRLKNFIINNWYRTPFPF